MRTKTMTRRKKAKYLLIILSRRKKIKTKNQKTMKFVIFQQLFKAFVMFGEKMKKLRNIMKKIHIYKYNSQNLNLIMKIRKHLV